VLHKCIGILACYSYKTVSVKLTQAKYILYLWVVGANYEASCSLSNNHKRDASSLCMEVCNTSWALAHFFEVRYPLPTQFFPLDR
jgi:hypothetical protein